jgi:hypothetical protein
LVAAAGRAAAQRRKSGSFCITPDQAVIQKVPVLPTLAAHAFFPNPFNRCMHAISGLLRFLHSAGTVVAIPAVAKMAELAGQ